MRFLLFLLLLFPLSCLSQISPPIKTDKTAVLDSQAIENIQEIKDKLSKPEKTSYLNLSIAIIAMVTSVVGLFVTSRNLKKSLLYNNISTYRLKWVDQLRVYLADFCTYSVAVINEASTKSDSCLTTNEIKQLHAKNQLLFHLNDHGNRIIIIEVIERMYMIKDIAAFEGHYDYLVFLVKKEISSQWEKAAEEAKVGRLNKTYEATNYSNKSYIKPQRDFSQPFPDIN